MLARKLVIYVTELTSFMFCELSYYFMKQKIPSKDSDINYRLLKGKITHSQLYNEHYNNSTGLETFDSALIKTLHDDRVRILRELRVSLDRPAYQLIGRIDEVRFEPTRIVIVDDKDTDHISPLMLEKYRLQLELYCYLLFEEYFPFFQIHYELRQANTEKTFLTGVFRPLTKYFWDSAIVRLIDFWSGELTLVKTTHPFTCSECLFHHSVCEGTI